MKTQRKKGFTMVELVIVIAVIAILAAVLIPTFVIGIICRDKKSVEFRSRMSVTAAKIGMGAGVSAAILFELIPSWKALLGGGVLPAMAVTSVGMLAANLFCKDKKNGLHAEAR